MKTDVIVIGAGASGLFCAMEAGKRGRSVALLDHGPEPGRKIAVSGGGHCNFGNRNVGPDHYLSGNPRFTASALARFTPGQFTALLDRHGIGYREREHGRLFCQGSARDIVSMLRGECERAGVRMVFDSTITEVRREERFIVSTPRGMFEAPALVIATGGLSYPGLGASNFGHATARQFGHRITPLHPALTPLLFGPDDARAFSGLSGISVAAEVGIRKVRFRESILFTHRGLSGPAILQVSSRWEPGTPIRIDLLPEIDILEVFHENRTGKIHLATLLDRFLPGRFVKAWCDLKAPSKPMNQHSPKELERVAAGLHNWEFVPAATEGFNKAEVTLGGVDTKEISGKTMESRIVPGLYFTGEVLDVTGELGGYNLHWAWASGYAAGQAV